MEPIPSGKYARIAWLGRGKAISRMRPADRGNGERLSWLKCATGMGIRATAHESERLHVVRKALSMGEFVRTDNNK